MKIVVRGETTLVTSAHLSHNGMYTQLIINMRERWIDCNYCGFSSVNSQEFPEQLAAFYIESRKAKSVLMLVPESENDCVHFANCVRYSNLEKDQMTIIWMPNVLESIRAVELATYGGQS